MGIDRGVNGSESVMSWGVAATVGSPSATGWDRAEFLDVDVHDFTGPGGLDTSNGFAGDSVDVVETVQSVSAQHGVHGSVEARTPTIPPMRARPGARLRRKRDDATPPGDGFVRFGKRWGREEQSARNNPRDRLHPGLGSDATTSRRVGVTC